MKTRILARTLITVLFSSLSLHPSAFSQVPGILNYQGRIVDNGTNFDGTGQFEFALVNPGGTTNYWSNDGTPVGQPASAVSLTVTKGLYSVLLGNTTVSNMTVAIPAGVFANSNVLLRVWFNDGTNGFQQLSPDQQLGAAGYALQAQNAAVAATANSTSPSSLIQGSYLNIGISNSVSGTLASVAGGQGNTVSAPYAFVGGGTGNQASGTNTTIGGGDSNVAEGDFSTIVGGQGNSIDFYLNLCYFGRIGPNYDFIGGGQVNSISSITEWGAIVGGYNNIIGAFCNFSSIGGGDQNDIDCYSSESTIGGGTSNNVQYSSSDSTIGGGGHNTIQTNTIYATIGGGATNTIQYGANNSIIGGGGKNTISTNAIYATIGGGQNNFAGEHHVSIGGGNSNTIQSNAFDSTIGGGNSNTIQSNAFGVTIGGGAFNTIQNGAESSAIAGGTANTIQSYATKSAIGGGYGNTIQSNAADSIIAGGAGNTIQSFSPDSTIGGGTANTVQSNANDSTIGGGSDNTIQSNAFNSTIGGGVANTIQSFSSDSTIGGGTQNIMGPPLITGTNVPTAASTIGGGAGNVISNAYYATIPGGQQAQATNYAQMAYSSGSFSTAGDGQFSLYVLRGVNCSTNPTTLYLDYPTSTQEIGLPADRACAYTISIVGRESGSAAGSARPTGCVALPTARPRSSRMTAQIMGLVISVAPRLARLSSAAARCTCK
ncbi:MAG TPA: hypothetical protein VMV72_07540 [Verrucomicrobiae bacterium]|nr:hypothetical protein [Verrucomicrobiae bacterium]